MRYLAFIWLLLYSLVVSAAAPGIEPAASQFSLYLPLLQGKRVALFANNASQVDGENTLNVLLAKGIHIVKIFSPEHGFSGNNDAGASVASSKESGITIISLYGQKTQASAADLADVDILVFDIQDVGVRYYTYISSLQKLMEAAVNNHKPLLILDRPNPNGFYIDGPVLTSKFKSFVGMQAIPLVYGMTIGEYAQMLVGEEWLEVYPRNKASQLQLTIIRVKNYTHASHYQLPVKPSPNLPNMPAIYWYPSLGWFEGTKLSIGRGTAMPFQVLGSPAYTTSFSFTPQAMPGAQNPPFKGQLCSGWDLQMNESQAIKQLNGQIDLKLLLNTYRLYPDKAHFFTSFFDKLAGTNSLRQQISDGASESQIRASWQADLIKFKTLRQKYLLYP